MLNFKVKITDAGNDTYGAWREGSHDDLVLAVALACWKQDGQPVALCRQHARIHAEDMFTPIVRWTPREANATETTPRRIPTR